MSARTCEVVDVRSTSRRVQPAAERDGLIVSYRPYVLKVARRIAEATTYHVEIDDLVGWGTMGLVEAAARFDATRGVDFRTYAHRRILGAMFDGIRKHHGPSAPMPLSDALIAASAISVELRARCADAGYAQVRHVLGRERRDVIADAMSELAPVERAILFHHYFNGEPVKELTTTTRLSKSWLSRLHSRALAKMRAALLARACDPEAIL